jgi:hypothetical protein
MFKIWTHWDMRLGICVAFLLKFANIERLGSGWRRDYGIMACIIYKKCEKKNLYTYKLYIKIVVHAPPQKLT